MQFSLANRTASLSVGEFSEFVLGPRESGGQPQGLWRAQLGQHWHNEMQTRTAGEHAEAVFEVPINGRLVHRGWTIALAGRLDQVVPATGTNASLPLIREIKTVTRPLPVDESQLRADYGGYFQDDIRVSNRLTVNVGVRYEYETGISERNNHMLVGFNQSQVNPIAAGLPAGSGVTPNGVVKPA